MRILTTNRHETYILNLSLTGDRYDVLESLGKESLKWDHRLGKSPDNLTLIEWSKQVEKNIKNGRYDIIILHTVKDLLFFLPLKKKCNIIFIIHIALYSHTFNHKIKWLLKRSIVSLFCRFQKCLIVAVSPWKASTWKLKNTRVVNLAPAKLAFPGRVEKELATVMTVGNNFRKREELNYHLLKEVSKKIKIYVFGANPSLANNIQPKNRDELAGFFKQHEIFLFTTPYPYNDGYNTSVLEAMEAGLAVVGLTHPTSLVVHGKGGFLGKSQEEIIKHLNILILNRPLALAFGRYNQKIIEKKFSRQKFGDNWRQLLDHSSSNVETK